MSAAFTPRLATSQQWTDLPTDFTLKVRKVFAEQFAVESTRGEFMVDGRIYCREVILRLGYLENGRLKQINFEASMDLPERKALEDGFGSPESEALPKTMERIYTCIDALGSVMEEYFDLDLEEEEEIDIPSRWREYKFEGEAIYLQHSTVNTRLEEEADRLLGLHKDSLVQEATPSEDALANADVDTELALDVQKAIRSGKYTPSEGELN